MSNGYTLYVMDTETTGLEEINDVIEISMSRFFMDTPSEQEQRTWYLKAENAEVIQDVALRINGHKREDILHISKFGRDTYKDPSVVVAEIERWILEDDVSAVDRVAGGQNIQFDIKMLKALWKRVGAEDTFPFAVDRGNRMIDTKNFALAIDLCTGRRRRYYNLSSLVKAFKVKKRRAHRAEDDVAMTVELLIKMLDPFKDVASKSFKDCYTDNDQ